MKTKIVKGIATPAFKASIDELPVESKIFVDKAMAMSHFIVKQMQQKGLKQKDLAAMLGKTEAEISKLLSGTHNYTLRMIAKFEAALETDIINIPFSSKSHMHYSKSCSIEKKSVQFKGYTTTKLNYSNVIRLSVPHNQNKSIAI